MKPEELTVDVVREELASLIERYPDRKGSIEFEIVYDDEFGYDRSTDFTCVYYLDENGHGISPDRYDYEDFEDQEINFVTPVCIVGQWIEDFHPNFKSDSLIRSLLRRNGTIRSDVTDLPFNTEVRSLLAMAQDAQDGINNTWKNIEL